MRSSISISLLTFITVLLLIILSTLTIIVNSSDAELQDEQINPVSNADSIDASSLSVDNGERSNVQFKSDISNTLPSINITYPGYPPTVTIGQIIITGVANDSNSGVHKITAVANSSSFNGNLPITISPEPLSIKQNNSTYWSVPLTINKTGVYTVQITAEDNGGKVNSAQTTIRAYDLEAKNMAPRISFVRSTFAEAAYGKNGFYDFYFKYQFPPFGTNITTDLDKLTVKIPKSVLETSGQNLSHLLNLPVFVPTYETELTNVSYLDFPYQLKFWIPFIEHIKKVTPNSTVTVMRDEDVHDGHIFYPDRKTNAYDLLLLSHNEYVTQQEYNNLRQFVKNGGTIVFIDPNTFYAEVKYDRANHTITLIKGHDWKFDGKSVSRSQPERWYNETKEWIGGNFLINDITDNVTFANNPFNYTHYEEQFVNNPKDKIIVDYKVTLPKNYAQLHPGEYNLPPDKKLEDIRVGTYTLDYGKGKVIMIGLYGQNFIEHQNQKFLRFFDSVILPKALCSKFKICANSTGDY